MNPQVILASSSRYRRELLRRILTEFQAVAPEVDERSFDVMKLAPDELALRLAREKASAVARTFPEALVIGSDQLVDLDGQVLGKPETVPAATSQLLAMSGRTHRLFTAVHIIAPYQESVILDEARLTMRHLTAAEAGRYVLQDSPLDCAGSYRIESLGISLFDRIECEDFTAIMGLPLIRVARSLRDLGITIP